MTTAYFFTKNQVNYGRIDYPKNQTIKYGIE